MNHIIQDCVQDKFSVANCRIFWVRTKSEHFVMQIKRMQYSELKNLPFSSMQTIVMISLIPHQRREIS